MAGMGWQDLAERPLNPQERGVLLTLLEAGGDEYAPLRDQLDAAVVTARCGCGCATVALSVADGAPRLRRADGSTFSGLLPVEAMTPDVGVLVFLYEGRLSSLEVYSWGDATGELPASGDLRILDRRGELDWPLKVRITSGEHTGKRGTVSHVNLGSEGTEYAIKTRRGQIT